MTSYQRTGSQYEERPSGKKLILHLVDEGRVVALEEIQDELTEYDVAVGTIAAVHKRAHSVQRPFEQSPAGFVIFDVQRDGWAVLYPGNKFECFSGYFETKGFSFIEGELEDCLFPLQESWFEMRRELLTFFA